MIVPAPDQKRLPLYILAFSAAVFVIAASALLVPEAFNTKGKHSKDPKRFWKSARAEVDKSVMEILREEKAEKARGLKYRKFISGNPEKPEIALTIDDGPHPKYTRELLRILDDYGIKATFFVVGEKAHLYPQLLREEVRRGHEIANHTYHHVDMRPLNDALAATEIKAAGKVIHAVTGRSPYLFRPPGGNYTLGTLRVADALGYTTVLWTANAGDAANISNGLVLYRVYTRTGNGGVILMHDGVQRTLDILPGIIETFQKKGYRFVTVGELMGSRKAPEARGGDLLQKMAGRLKKAIRKKTAFKCIIRIEEMK